MQKRIETDPDDWYAAQYFEKKKRSKKRTCSYCSYAGHNRKTCLELKHAKGATEEKAMEWRHKALTYFKHLGLGVGTIVKYDKWNDGQFKYAMVKEILWNLLDHRYSVEPYHDARCFNLSDLGKDMRRADYRSSFPKDKASVITSDAYNPYHAFEVVSPLRPETIESQVPDGWLLGKSCIKAIFDKDTQPFHVSSWVSLQGFYENS